MGNYKKSILSVAAAAAISSTALTAAYLPLTDGTNDNRWVLFGVNGFKTDGVVSSVPGEFSVADSAATAITDVASNELYTSGLSVGGHDYGRLEALGATSIEIRLNTTGVTWAETEPFRTIYIDTSVPADGAPDFAFTYKASLEGRTLEYQVAGSIAYSTVINSANTFSNPAVGTAITGIEGSSGVELRTIADTIDYDFTGNPPEVAQYDQAVYQTAWTDETLRLYSYDAENKKWDIYDRANNPATNDFSSFTKGKGYWGKIDADGDGTTADADSQKAGFVLDSSVITTTDYATAGIADGWNLISFDSSAQEIRNASTGIIATVTPTAAGTFTLTDASGNHTVTVTLANLDTMAAVAKKTNSAISQAIALGTMPKTFNLRAFPVDASKIAFISNKKFTLIDLVAGDDINTATTLAGGMLLNPVTLGDTPNGTNVDAVGVMSKYGEFAMVIEALHGGVTDSIQTKTLGSSVEVTAGATPTAQVLAIGATNAATETALEANANTITYEIDTNLDGTLDKILMTSTSPFYLRDHTFSRVFAYTDSAVDGTIAITNPTIANQTIPAAAQTTALQVSGVIDGIGAISAGTPSNDLTKIVFAVDTASGSDFAIAETVGDHLTVSTTNSDMAKGAVKGVYSLNYLAEKAVNNLVTVSTLQTPDDVADRVRFDIVTVFGNTITGTVITPDLTSEATILGSYVTQINTDLADNNLTATASSNGSLALGLTVSGTDVQAITITYTANGGANDENTIASDTILNDLGYITAITPDLSGDLKYNAVYSPDYVMQGPLYTMRASGMALKALVTGTTDLTDGTVNWNSIDLTRKPSEWLDSQDYNLFKTDDTSGYWAYLVTDTSANPISITNASIAKNYSYHFDTNGNTYNHYSGQLSVTVSGISDLDDRLSARVVADVAGDTVELVRDGSTDVYTGKISAYETYNFALDTAYDVRVTVADGLGNKVAKWLGAGAVGDVGLNLASFDNVKPAAPSITFTADNLGVTATSAAANGIYLFENVVPENYASGNELYKTASSTATVANICKDMTPVTIASTPSTLLAVALDGNGVWGQGNASNQTSAAYMPILKSRMYAANTNTGSKSITYSASDYNVSCQVSSVAANTGLTISSVTADKIAKIAYEKVNAQDITTSVPITVYLAATSGGTTSKVELKYDGAYVGKTAFVMIDGKTYTFTLESEAAIIAGAGGESDVAPRDITGTLKAGVAF